MPNNKKDLEAEAIYLQHIFIRKVLYRLIPELDYFGRSY